LFDAEFLRNGTRCRDIYSGIVIRKDLHYALLKGVTSDDGE